MSTLSYNSKINSTKSVVESLKESVMQIFWDEDPFEFCSSRSLLPLIQEDAEYSIKELHLKEQDQSKYLQKVEQVLGEFCEV